MVVGKEEETRWKKEGGGRGEGLGNTYKYSQTSRVEDYRHTPPTTAATYVLGGTTISNSIVSRRRYQTTRTSYSTFSTKPNPSSLAGKNPSVFPASGLTGDEEMYADGAEFAETGYMAAQGSPEVSITQEEARALRRRWKRKRHHGKRRGGRKTGAGRRRRGRRGRKHKGARKAATAAAIATTTPSVQE